MNRIVKRSLIGLAVLTGIPVFLIMTLVVWIIIETYWTVDMKFERDTAGELAAVTVAQGYGPVSSLWTERCDWDHPSVSMPKCIVLSWGRRGICRWWLGEYCQPYETSGIVLRDNNLLGKMAHAIIDPCSQYSSSSWCKGDKEFGEQRYPVVVRFKKNSEIETLRIRFDFPEGFTTAAREKSVRKSQERRSKCLIQ